MDINWVEIKDEMKRDVEEIFKSNNPPLLNIEEGINLFQKVIYSKIDEFELGGLSKTLPLALNDAYTTSVGKIVPLRIIADSLEPYLKKIALIANIDTKAVILRTDLMPLLKKLNINQALSSQSSPTAYPQLTESNQLSFKGTTEYLEFICESYLTRNKIHASPDWNRAQVITKITSLLVVYIYAALKFKNFIDQIPDVQPITSNLTNKISTKDEYLYYFISFGSTTNKIRNQIVTSYLLNHIKDTQNNTLETVQKAVNTFFNTEMNTGYYERIIGKLLTEKKIVKDKETMFLQLSPEELIRITTAQKNFDENRAIFFLFLEEIAIKYNILPNINDLFDKLQNFIESNYNIDIAEAYDRGVTANDENVNVNNFSNYLSGLVGDKVIAQELFKDLLHLSKDSDFLMRMCASKAFATLTNPDRFQEYINNHERIVYLDTRIILFALCLNYVTGDNYDNNYYQTTKELIDLANRNRNIKLKVSRLYLKEVSFQLKLALMLIPFEGVAGEHLSSNIFYRFYWHLKENSMLHDEDKTLSDFLFSWFGLKEEDAYSSNFFTIAYNNLYDYLAEPELNIEVETLPNYDNRIDAVSALNKVLGDERKNRAKVAIDNDSVMMCHLCNSQLHLLEPFFLTWDKIFTPFRKEYISQFQRTKSVSFHLLSPSRFINHYSLINLKINPQAFSNTFLSIIDSNDIYENTQTLWDAVSRFLNIENINPQKRKIYIGKIKEIFEKEFDFTIEDFSDLTEKNMKVLNSFEDTMTRINDYYSYGNKYSLEDYRNLMLSEDYFNKVSELIFQSIIDSEKENALLDGINSLIANFKKPPSESSSSNTAV